MATKQMLPDQCNVLHPIYGQSDCCLCYARMENRKLKEILKKHVALHQNLYYNSQPLISDSMYDELKKAAEDVI